MFGAEVKLLFERDLASIFAGKRAIFSTFILALLLEAAIALLLRSYGYWEFAYSTFLPCAAWAVFVLVGMVCVYHSFRVERRNMVFLGVLINPPDAVAIFVAKAAANLCVHLMFMAAILAIHLTVWENIQNIGSAVLILLGGVVVLGFVVVATLVTARTLHWKHRKYLFPLSLIAVVTPQIFSVSRLTIDSVVNGYVQQASVHFAIAAGYDIIAILIAWAMFDNSLMRRRGPGVRSRTLGPPGLPGQPGQPGQPAHPLQAGPGSSGKWQPNIPPPSGRSKKDGPQ